MYDVEERLRQHHLKKLHERLEWAQQNKDNTKEKQAREEIIWMLNYGKKKK